MGISTKKIISGIKKSWILITVAITITLASTYALFSHYNVSEYREDFIYLLESKLLDYKFKLRGTEPGTGKVGILAIDEKTLTKFGEYPFNRKYYRKVYENLKKLGVKVIGFDVIYIESQKANLEDAKDALKEIEGNKNLKENFDIINQMYQVSPADHALSLGIEEFEDIVLGYFYFESENEAEFNLGSAPRFAGLEAMEDSAIPEDFMGLVEGKTLDDYRGILKVAGIRTNNTSVNTAGQNFAFFSNQADEDAINRWVT